MGASSLFHKRSKGSMSRKASISEEQPITKHSRSMSTSSTISSTSSTASRHCYDPLSLHPPLSINTSPMIPELDEDGCGNFGQRRPSYWEPESPRSSTSTGSPYINHDRRRNTYVYDQHLQWPLKDWQAVPPGLADMNEDEIRAYTAPRSMSTSSATSQRRPRKEGSAALSRGEWKRRGIVFQLDSEGEDEQTRHFEVNPFEFSR
ncbi:hypothetical protein JX265_008419 [Neoarthrinium moseri]|uniref:Uncharacterized protein n=1 Tax=Neoarthrinium moseri TaxID=1658444 RepID=A0A9P9WI67_9PEZI|nr:uncharacterized protein JN550_001423 [Neoarthrinium moseri]KAI1844996.1 hypothetical protein JX266_008789 [Neoarthrinium moseri]KAI1864695.1 hypothetical protein JX265_008419 [Neoarthrinium moseri]KAI1875927.1 hypothetical protein JN550_001423 [Neoarthrinium moseri]